MKLHDNPLFHIFHISKTIERMVQTTIQKECGVSYADAKLLMLLGTHPEITQQKLAEELVVSPPAISRQLDRLEKEGYLTRTDNPENRRASRIKLTKKGNAMQHRVSKYLDTLLEKILADTGGVRQSTIKNLHTISRMLIQEGECRFTNKT